ncbi:hypothetical protein Ciccas_014422 [Cichlidogyrus casuarinus]|uniref:Uncharacterized protein n=1 Tax=Cichlidogyrus casuarinus TaxID=1844966 RepID=A0ABD2PIC7_9PLAT
MGLGFGRFAERSWLDSRLFSSAVADSVCIQAEGESAFISHFFAKVFWFENETTSRPESLDLKPTASRSGKFIKRLVKPSSSSCDASLGRDFGKVLQNETLSDMRIIFQDTLRPTGVDFLDVTLPVGEDCFCSACPELALRMQKHAQQFGCLPNHLLIHGCRVSELVATSWLRFIYTGLEGTESCLEMLPHQDLFTLLSLAKTVSAHAVNRW